MRYYNENPQVTLWREKYESLKAENENLKDEISYLMLDVNQFENILQAKKKFYEFETKTTEERAKKAFLVFNSLPWYKKMFYKFKI